MSNPNVWLNGDKVGGWPYGYSSFRIDLTDQLHVGQDNTVVIRLDNKEKSSRWYLGGGIYRNVWLVKTAPEHIAHWGISATTPTVSSKPAEISISAQLTSSVDELQLHHAVYVSPGSQTSLRRHLEHGQ